MYVANVFLSFVRYFVQLSEAGLRIARSISFESQVYLTPVCHSLSLSSPGINFVTTWKLIGSWCCTSLWAVHKTWSLHFHKEANRRGDAAANAQGYTAARGHGNVSTDACQARLRASAGAQ